MRTVLVTGAAGNVGQAALGRLLSAPYALRLVDRVPLPAGGLAPRPGDEVVVADLAAPGACAAAVDGVDAVVHLAGIPTEAPLADVLAANVAVTGALLEASRLAEVRRFVLASTNHVTGFYPVGERIGPGVRPRPDTFYGASKAAAEALVSLYADKFGLSGVALRIGSAEPVPTQPRQLASWLSPGDTGELLHRSVVADVDGFLVVYGVSDNAASWWSRDGWAELGYMPVDRAEEAYRQADPALPQVIGPDEPQGGGFAEAATTLGVLG